MKRLAAIAFLFCIGFEASALTTADAYLPIRSVPDSLEQSKLTTDTASYLFRQVAEGLFAVGEGYQIYPRLAESTEWSADQKTLSIHLRNAKFSDGSPVSVRQVEDALLSCVKNSKKTLLVAVPAIEGYEAFVQGRAKGLSGLKAIGNNEIEIHLSRRSPLLMDDLAQADCHIVKPAENGSRDLLKGAIGSGPYRIRSTHPTEITLERNPYYYTATNGPDVAIFRQTEDFGRFERLKSWVTMATVDYDPKSVDPAFDAVGFSELGSHQLIFNNAKAPFNRASIRRAVALALDYRKLAESLGWSPDTLQAGLVPLGMTGFKKREIGDHASQLAKARHLLKEAGYSERHPLRFTILISTLPTYDHEAELWPKLFQGAPIEVKTELLEHSERNARIAHGDFQAARTLKFAGSIEPHRVFSSYLSQSTYNPTRSDEPACDRLTLAATATADQASRLALYERADRCLADQQILIPLASIQPGYVLMRKPWKLTRTNRYLLYPYSISEWWHDGPG